MQVTVKVVSETITKLTVSADYKDLARVKRHVVAKSAQKIKVQGFREGKVPVEIAEKHLDANFLQSEVLDEAINHLYIDAINQNRLRVVAPPKVELKKFVPYTDLEFTAEVEVVGKITLPEYKNLNIKIGEVKVTAADVKEILERLQKQASQFKDVTRVAKESDRITIDFEGTDEKGQPVKGATGKDYQLILGSKTFIPGFEDNLNGTKAGQEKTFKLIFPKDYQIKVLQSKKVTFKVIVNKIEETITPDLNDVFAAKVGPFKNLEELKKDISKQLELEKSRQAQAEFEDKIIKTIVDKTKLTLPESILNEQIEAVDKEFRQNLDYRGETFEEYLTNTVQTEQEYHDKELKPAAETRLKAGLVLSEIAELENINVSPEEIEIRIQVLKGQYTSNPEINADLEKPETRRNIASRLLTEKTIAKLVSYNKKL
ncbi:MAG TPA: trigger factor [Patescibacteria group bacterium]|nr:trigger factor [Patescibacteria group bacterium]